MNYALKYISEISSVTTAQHLRDEAILIRMPSKPEAIAVISAATLVDIDAARQYYLEYPDMDFLCGYQKECAWEGPAIQFLETNQIGWGSAGTLGSAVTKGEIKSASHKDYFFSYRLVRHQRSVVGLDREFDRVFTMKLANGRSFRVGMIMEYEPTADAIRTFWDRFGPIDIAWNINPNGHPTPNAIEAGQSLGCEVLKWEGLRAKIRSS